MAQQTSQQTSVAAEAGRRRAGWLAAQARASLRRPDFGRAGARPVIVHVLRVAGAGLLVWIGYIHWLIWHEGYKYIPTDGPFFLVDAVAAVVLAVALLAWPRPAVGLASTAFIASTIAALLVSLWIGLFGFHESISASFVVQSLWLESIATAALLAWSLVALAAVPADPR